MQTRVGAAFAAVYLIWGSTYLAIRFVIETLPPFFMAGTRFLIAGAIMYVWSRFRGSPRPSSLNWRSASVVGGLMLLGGHGGVILAEQWLPSSLTSVLIATVPLWLVLLDSVISKKKIDSRVSAGLVVGFLGVGLLVNPGEVLGGSRIDMVVALGLVLAAFLWASGSLYSRTAPLPSSQLMSTAMEMLAGGGFLMVASTVTGEWMRLRLDLVSERSLFAWIYLIVFGSLIGFTSYVWLLKVASTARVSTYAYVNPVVAMILGWTLAGETLTLQNLLAAAIILAAVIVITTHRPSNEAKKEFS